VKIHLDNTVETEEMVALEKRSRKR